MPNRHPLRSLIRPLSCALLVLPLARPVLAQSTPDTGTDLPVRRIYSIARTADPIRVDAVLDEPAWQTATPIAIGYEWEPGENTASPVDTEVRLLYSEGWLYAAFEAHDPEPGQIRAYLRDRDNGTTDDHIGLMIDTFNDSRRAFQFRVNALGVQMDAIFDDIREREDWSWDAIWNSAGRITGDGYIVELAIPFSSLRFPGTGAVQTWGFMVFRSWPRGVRHGLRSCPTDRRRPSLLDQTDLLTGFQGIHPGRNLEFVPTLTTTRSDAIPSGGLFTQPRQTGLVRGAADTETGLSASWGITPNLILNGAVNPDFSQVEADVAQLEVNTRFALRYPERRPFFMEGADFFTTPGPVVFTRTVADPLYGLKLTGKEGRHAIGAFVVRDRVNNLLIPSNERSRQDQLDQEVTTAVLRHRYDLGRNSAVGILFSNRKGNDYSNRMLSFDGMVRLGRSESFTFQLVGSRTAYPDTISARHRQPTEPFTGHAWFGTFTHTGREWWYGVSVRGISPEFRADAGFVPQADEVTYTVSALKFFWGDADTWFTRIETGPMCRYQHDVGGALLTADLGYGLRYLGPLQSEVTIMLLGQTEVFAGQEYRYPNLQVLSSLRPTGRINLECLAQRGGAIDYTNAREADQLLLAPQLELFLGRRFSAALQHTYQRLSDSGIRIYTANLSQLRLLYHLNVRMFVRAILQYQGIDCNPDQYVVPATPKNESLFTQLLLSYKVNPQTVLFLGYSDNHLGGDFGEILGTIRLTRTGRTFFMKVGYALVL